MNNNDSMHVMEHAAVTNVVYGAANAIAQARHEDALRQADEESDSMLFGGVAIALKIREKNNVISRLSTEVREVANQRNDVTAVVKASTKTIKALVAELAAVKRVPIEVIQQQANNLRSQEYDAITDDLLSSGFLTVDARLDHEFMKQRDWYSPR